MGPKDLLSQVRLPKDYFSIVRLDYALLAFFFIAASDETSPSAISAHSYNIKDMHYQVSMK